MRIAIVSDLETAGGAAVATSRLASGLVAAGADVVRLVGTCDSGPHPWQTIVVGSERRRGGPGASAWLKSAVSRWWGDGGPRLAAQLRETAPDVINIHNLHAAGWGPELLEICAKRAPTVWTLHDMWSFTGRCAYSYDCIKYIAGCDAMCPTPTEYPVLRPERIGGAWRKRRRLLAHHPDVTAVCPSRWLQRTARAGLWRHHRVELIPYGLPLATYRPVHRAAARAELRLNADGLVIAFVSHSLTDRRKGGPLVAQALRSVKHRPFTLLTAGYGELDVDVDGIELRALGFVDDTRTRVLAYNAADLSLHPAPVDNLPNVVMEALACGTPSVGFPIGGVVDMVRPGVTGWLADDVTPEALGAAIDRAIEAIRDRQDLRDSCRNVAEREFDDRLQAQRYLALFESVTGGRRRDGYEGDPR